jgi:hypothetical protein
MIMAKISRCVRLVIFSTAVLLLQVEIHLIYILKGSFNGSILNGQMCVRLSAQCGCEAHDLGGRFHDFSLSQTQFISPNMPTISYELDQLEFCRQFAKEIRSYAATSTTVCTSRPTRLAIPCFAYDLLSTPDFTVLCGRQCNCPTHKVT